MSALSRAARGRLPTPARRRPAGFTYLIALFAVAVAGAMLGAGSVVWHKEAERARERELLRIGGEFRRAVGSYYEGAPDGIKKYPQRLEDLLSDSRYLSVRRHLRRIYRDPLTGEADWGLVLAPGGGVMGVHSRSDAPPIKVAGFDEADRDFASARRYSDWKFVYAPPVLAPAAKPSPEEGAPEPR